MNTPLKKITVIAATIIFACYNANALAAENVDSLRTEGISQTKTWLNLARNPNVNNWRVVEHCQALLKIHNLQPGDVGTTWQELEKLFKSAAVKEARMWLNYARPEDIGTTEKELLRLSKKH